MNNWREFCVAMEACAGMRASAAEWKLHLGDEFSQFPLLATNEKASSIPTSERDSHRWVKVVDHGEDDSVGVDLHAGKTIPLDLDNVTVYRVDDEQLCRNLAIALDLMNRKIIAVADIHQTWRIGEMREALVPVYLSVPIEERHLQVTIHALVSLHKSPFLLLAPTARFLNPMCQRLLTETDSQFLELFEAIVVAADNGWQATATARYRMKQMTGDGGQLRNAFRRQDKHWELIYDGTRIQLNDLDGLFYIRELLYTPEVGIHASLLKARAACKDSRLFSGSRGPMSDDETLAAYDKRLSEIQEELEAEKDSISLLKIEALNEEKEMIGKEVRRCTGPDGQIRDDSDAEHARKAVQKSINYAIEKIQKRHEALANHLEDKIDTGTESTYRATSPPIEWDF